MFSVNEYAALMLVLADTDLKALLQAAMIGFASEDSILAQSIANTCSQALNTYLR